jgi:hypothetical protein
MVSCIDEYGRNVGSEGIPPEKIAGLLLLFMVHDDVVYARSFRVDLRNLQESWTSSTAYACNANASAWKEASGTLK